MIKNIIALLVISTLFLLSCKEENPVKPEVKKVGSIEGFTTEASNGRSISQVFITTENSSHAVTSEIDGFYEIPNIKPGEYKLFAKKDGFDDAEISISVDTGYTTRADFVMYREKTPGGIAGRVFNSADGIGIPAAVISTEPYAGSVSTDAFGIYSLTNIPADVQYNIIINKSGFESKTIAITSIADSTLKLDIVLDPIFGIIEGKVSDATNGSALTVVNITTSPATSSVTTDADGKYKIENVPRITAITSKYTIIATKAGYTEATVDVNLIPGKTVEANILMYKN
ncbi:MAG: carboxypeptidase regulatory-like domain-containing protein [Melioribacteraceae bacterium]|nr:carboxypeptidase regulatory-like domain-containing protein [Melioribacteraceae bacterium]